MSKATGIDVGSAFLKVANGDHTAVIPIAANAKNAAAERFGWDAYAARFSDSTSVATRFLNDPAKAELAKDFLRYVQSQHSVVDPAVVLPRQISPADLGGSPLVQAIAASTLNAQVFVSGWVAALAAVPEVATHSAILISLGATSTQLWVSEFKGRTWEAVNSTAATAISGDTIRRELMTSLAGECLAQYRIDLNDRPDSRQQLADAVDTVLASVRQRKTGTANLQVGDNQWNRPISPGEISSLCTQSPHRFQERLYELIDDSIDAESDAPSVVVIWGELCELLPMQSWLRRKLPAARIEHLSSNALAEAAGLIGPWASKNANRFPSVNGAAFVNSLPIQLSKGLKIPLPTLQRLESGAVVEGRPIIGDHYRIGRHEDASWSVQHEMVSRAHAVIRKSQPGAYCLVDLASTNGTLLNHQKVEPKIENPLKDGDQIQFGEVGGVTFRFHYPM